ncbi:MAG: hypothetical protein KKH52_04550 [Nanoarchaeota archaeon]|nr:hypothetical protein [Nanoarchaeota archaeon]MBU1974636.1 hypothetical protein [Nanoarchaeota archaeon]
MKRTITRIYESSRLEKCTDVGVFIANGIIRRSKSNFVLTTPHFLKVNVLIRFILYAIFDILIKKEKPLRKRYLTFDQ